MLTLAGHLGVDFEQDLSHCCGCSYFIFMIYPNTSSSTLLVTGYGFINFLLFAGSYMYI